MDAVDTRNFTQIVNSLSRQERMDLTTFLMKNMGISERSVRYYFRGDRKPDYCKQQVIVKGLKLLGIKTNAQILFDGQ